MSAIASTWYVRACKLRVTKRFYSSWNGILSKEEAIGLQQQLQTNSTRLLLPNPGKVAQTKRRALTVMVGWMASSLRAVSKHATIYTGVGIPVLCVTPNVFQVWSSRLGSSLTRSLLNTMDQCLESPVSMILHTFSGASHACLPAMVADFGNSSSMSARKMVLSCAIFDSGPPLFSLGSGLKAARLMYEQGGYTYPVYIAGALTGVVVNAVIGHKKRAELDESLQSPFLDVPQLYLYSMVDQVATPPRVQKIILDQKALGREVFSYCFKDSQHVRHYIGDPVTYEHHVHSLLKNCQLLHDNR